MICCKDCKDRSFACWDRCEHYQTEKAKEEREKEEKRAQDTYERQYTEYEIELRYRSKRRSGRK